MRLQSFGKTLAARSALVLLTLSLAACGEKMATVAPTAPPVVATIAATAAPTVIPQPTEALQPTKAPQPTDESTAEIEVSTSAAELSTDAPVQDVGSMTSSADIDPCTLLDQAAVEVLFGKLGSALVAQPTDKHNGRACAFDAQKVALTVEVYDSTDAPISVLLPELEQRGITMAPEVVTADEAYSGSTADRAILLELKNTTVVLLDLVNKTDSIKRAAVLLKGLGAAALIHLSEQEQTAAQTPEPIAEATDVQSASNSGASDAQQSCALLTVDEVEQALGKLDGAPDGSMQDDSGTPSCAYSAQDGLLFISSSPGDDAALQQQQQRVQQHGASLESLPGLGDAAFIAAAKIEGAPNKNALQGIIIVRKGNTLLRLGTLSEMSAAKTKAVLQQLAQLALARVGVE